MSDPRKWRAFAARYVVHFNASRAAEEVGVSKRSAGQQGYLWLKNPKVQAMIDERLKEVHMSADEALARLAEIARGDLGEFLTISKDGEINLDLSAAQEKTKLIKRIKQKKVSYNGKNFDREIETEEIELYSALDAIEKVLRVHGKFNDKLQVDLNAEIIVKKVGIDVDEL
jgi:phage terminase small subunit